MRKTLLTIAVVLALGGCGGGGGSSSAGNTNGDGEILSGVATGYVLPTEISAVPTDSGTTPTGVRMTGFASRLTGLAVADLPAASDYKQARTKKYVEERALERFDIIEQVMNAVAQTRYSDAANINAGPYTAMVAWVDEQDGREVKTLEPWVVDSRMIVVGSQDVNRVLAWIEEPDFDNPGQMRLIKAEFKIYQSAALNADGSFQDYGEWDLNVSFDATGTKFFAASSRIANGLNTVKVHEKGTGGGPGDAEMKSILVRSGAAGYGKVSYPDQDFCWQSGDPQNCTPPMRTAQYAYNAAYVAVDNDVTNGSGDAVYRDRDPANAVAMTHRYGLYYADAATGIAAGDDLQKHKSFGFPLRYTDSNGFTRHAYYGAWQGRHEIWGGDGLQAGDTVTRDDRGPNATAETYTVSASFNGTLTKRTLAAAAIDDIQGIPVETWINEHFNLIWSGSAWQYCDKGYITWSGQPPAPQCIDFVSNQAKAMSDFTGKLNTLIVNQGDNRKWVHINRWDSQSQPPTETIYLYLNDALGASVQNYTVPGFYLAQQDFNTGQKTLVLPAALYTPQAGDNLNASIGGSIYIQYTGDFVSQGATGWVQKTLTAFDQQNWRPTFDPNGDVAFSPAPGTEYYVHANGTNFVVRRIGSVGGTAADYQAKIELQTAANPVNYATILPTGTSYLATPWRRDVRFTLVTDSGSANFLKLVFLTDDPNTPDNDVGAVRTNGEWGLQAFDSLDQPLRANGTAITALDPQTGFPTDPNDRGVEFNWEYSAQDGWGTQKFLIAAGNSYLILSDPVSLDAITVTNGANQQKTLLLQFDGWMHGLPDLYHELSQNDWQMTADISGKVINIAEGTAVTDANSGAVYYVKPLEVSVFLREVANTTPGVPAISDADPVDLATVPNFTPHGMGAKPSGTVVKYSEGNPVGS